MVPNPGKCHFMGVGNNSVDKSFIFENAIMENTKDVTMLGVTKGNKLNFQNHIKILCTKASQKICALSSLFNYLDYN